MMKPIPKILGSLALLLALAACDQPGQHPNPNAGNAVDETTNLCDILNSNGLTRLCRSDAAQHSVDVMIESSDEQVGRETCDTLSGKLKPITTEFKADWKLQIYSVYRDDKPLAICALH